MEAWLIYHKASAEYNRSYIQMYIEEGAKVNLRIRLILIEELEFGVRDNELYLTYENQKLQKPAFAICRVIYPLLSKHLELMGIRVFNNSFVSEICNDKARTYQYLARTGIKMVDSSFWLNSQIREILPQAKSNSVIKAVDGHGGSQVFLLGERIDEKLRESESKKQALEEIYHGLGSSDIVLQPFTGTRNQDLRVYVLGREVVAAVLRTSKEGFRSNYSLGGEVTLYQLSSEEEALVNTIVGQFKFDLVGIDFIIGEKGELIFNEIEDVVGSRMLYQCSDINLVEQYISYIIKALN